MCSVWTRAGGHSHRWRIHCSGWAGCGGCQLRWGRPDGSCPPPRGRRSGAWVWCWWHSEGKSSVPVWGERSQRRWEGWWSGLSELLVFLAIISIGYDNLVLQWGSSSQNKVQQLELHKHSDVKTGGKLLIQII